MLPTGHLATGYLASREALAFLAYWYPQSGQSQFLVAGIVFSLLPDIDFIYFFFTQRTLAAGTAKNGVNHRKYISHAPALHLGIAAVGWLLSRVFGSSDGELLAVMYWVGTWTHFASDSFFYGIAWLWPFSRQPFAFASSGKDFNIQSTGTVDFWKKFAVRYSRTYVFYLEIVLIVIAITFFFNKV